jgi:predicted glycoside hydrolase/deacetylase ChbG (UPF0249 family)
MGKEVIINADDFGISRGVNNAIVKMHLDGNLNSASLMVCAKYSIEAVESAKKLPDLKVGLHFNLTTGRSVLHNISLPLLTNEDGTFKNGFLKLLILSIFKRKAFLGEVEAELKAQTSLIKVLGIQPSHIDGHRHIHYIFGVFNLVQKIAKDEKINRVRVINESLVNTLKLGVIPPLSGLVKLFVLKFLGFFNGASKVKAPYFFSIVHSCKLSTKLTQKFKLKEGYDAVEFMVHPSIVELDAADDLEYEKSHLTSKFRNIELNFIKPKV